MKKIDFFRALPKLVIEIWNYLLEIGPRTAGPRTHIGPVAHFVDVGVTRNVKGCQKLQSGWPTHFVDQHICWCGWCSVTVQFVVSGLLIDTICWSGDVFRINILRKRPILLVHLINIHNGYAFRNNILCLKNQHSVPFLFLFSILPSISLPILVRNHTLLFWLILTISVLQKGKVF